jgi:SAM-dependent methyltransferase
MRKVSLDTIQSRYRDRAVARRYDKRYSGLQGSLNYRAMQRALRKALAEVPAGGTILDAPCGTGMFTWFLARLGYKTVAGDISLQMLELARTIQRETVVRMPEFFQGDLFRLPFRDRAFDAVVCVRFMNLVERSVRVRAVREMARVADVLIVAYYHKYTWKYLGRAVRHKLGLRDAPNPRLSWRQLLDEIAETGLQLSALISVAPVLSEAWIAVLKHPDTTDATR